jgi:hypothetical protein
MSEQVVCVRDDWEASHIPLYFLSSLLLPRKGDRFHVRAAVFCPGCGARLVQLAEQPGPFCYDADFFRPEVEADGEAELGRLRRLCEGAPAVAPARRELEPVGCGVAFGASGAARDGGFGS